MKQGKLKQSDLDKIHRELMKSAAPAHRNKKGEPVYQLYFCGTKKQAKAIQRKLFGSR